MHYSVLQSLLELLCLFEWLATDRLTAKPLCLCRGSGTITVWENVGGKRGAQLYELPGIPLTPGPLLVVVKVAASQVRFASQLSTACGTVCD